MHNAAREAIDLIEVVASDTKLKHSVRQEARRLVPLAASQPELVEVRLEALRQRVVPDLPLWPPRDARCVSVDVFWRFHLATNHRDFFRQSGYLKFLESQAGPSAVARSQLAGDVVQHRTHGFLRRRSLVSTVHRPDLGCKSSRPPYLVMIFPMALMRAGCSTLTLFPVGSSSGPPAMWSGSESTRTSRFTL